MGNIFKDADKRRRIPPVAGETIPEEVVTTPEPVAEETVDVPELVAEEKPVVKKQAPKKKTKKIDALIGPAEGGEKEPKKTFSIYITEELYAWVKHEADLRNKSVSSLIEQILTDLRDDE